MNEADWGRVARTPCVSEYEVWLLARLEAEAQENERLRKPKEGWAHIREVDLAALLTKL